MANQQTFQMPLPMVAWTTMERNFTTGARFSLQPAAITLTGLTTATVGSRYVATATSAGSHGFQTGQLVTISGVTPSGYNKTAVVTVTSPTQFTFVVDSALSNSTVHGQAQGLIEFQQAIILNTDTTNNIELYLNGTSTQPFVVGPGGQFNISAPARTKMFLNDVQLECPISEIYVVVYYV